jgi:CRP-like cAMP-binding protein
MRAEELLATVPLLADLDGIAGLMRPFAVPAGRVLFREGEQGDTMYVVGSGQLRATRAAPGATEIPLATLRAGDVVGELSLLGPGARTATVTAVGDSAGWALDRPAFALLHGEELRRRLGELAIRRLHDRYAAIAEELAPAALDGFARDALDPVPPEPGEQSYLAGTLFFAGLPEEDVAVVAHGARRLEASRGAVIVHAGEVPSALYLVVRGAVETTVRGVGRARRVRLAGPGRAVGHLGPVPSLVECRARERSILLELPWARVGELGPAFRAALYEDVVRALLDAERPLPVMATTSPPRAPAPPVRARGRESPATPAR